MLKKQSQTAGVDMIQMAYMPGLTGEVNRWIKRSADVHVSSALLDHVVYMVFVEGFLCITLAQAVVARFFFIWYSHTYHVTHAIVLGEVLT